jgi:pterin-4a-carbinolamine dehydratase
MKKQRHNNILQLICKNTNNVQSLEKHGSKIAVFMQVTGFLTKISLYAAIGMHHPILKCSYC